MGKSKSTKTETSRVVQTPTNPEWVTGPLQGAMGDISKLSTLDPSSLIAPLTGRENAAFARADKLGVDNDWFSKALSSGAPSVSAASLLDGLDRYKSGYENDVINASMADFDADRDKTLSQLALDMTGGKKFQGSGGALAVAETRDALGRGRASLGANLRDQGHTRAAELSNLDAQRRQSASEANAQLSLQDMMAKAGMMMDRDANERANIATMAGAGATEREVDQALRMSPITALQARAGLIGSLPLQLYQGQTQDGTSTTTSKQSGGMLQSLGTLAMGLGSLGLAPFTGGASLFGLGAGAGAAAKTALALGAGAMKNARA